MPVHAAAHLGRFDGSLSQCIEHGDGVNHLAGNGGTEFLHFGMLEIFVFCTEKLI
jgi:hypothetical protein